MGFAGLSKGFLLTKQERKDKEFENRIQQGRQEEEAKERERKDQIEAQDPTRCFKCHRKIGLTAIRCHCQYYFCGRHRYAEQHECSFDYRRQGKQQLEAKLEQVTSDKLPLV